MIYFFMKYPKHNTTTLSNTKTSEHRSINVKTRGVRNVVSSHIMVWLERTVYLNKTNQSIVNKTCSCEFLV